MQECLTEKYRESPRQATHRTIDHPVLLLSGRCTIAELGLTIGSLLISFRIFSGFSLLFAPILAALVYAILVSYRTKFIPGSLQHWAWGQRALKRPGIPQLFTQRYLGRFGP
mgnify:CR=1 FL=1|jgi:hypothetical protein